MDFQRRIKYERKQRNFTQEDLATILEVTPMAISHWENGTNFPTFSKLKELCKVLNINLSDVINLD